MLAPICFFVCQSQQTIDLEVRASRLPLVVEALAAKTNEKLFCSPQLGRHVVLVKFTSVTPAEAKRKIAEAVDAEWQDRNGTLTLIRSVAKERELRKKWRDQQIKVMETSLAKLFEQLDKAPKFNAAAAQKLLADLNAQDARAKENEESAFADWAKLAVEHARGPGGRAVTRVLRLLGPAGIADLPVGRTVLAIDPTNLQRPLPREAKGVLRTWTAEQETWEVAMEGRANSERGMMMGTDPRLSIFGDGEVTRLLLVANKYGPKSNINFDLQGFNSSGKLICRASMSANPPAYSPEKVLKANLAVREKPNFTLSKEALERHSFSRLDYKDAKRPSAEWVKILSDPVTRDPLSFEHSEVLLALAKEANRNMVSSLTDDLRIPVLDEPNPGPINLEGYLKSNEMMLAIGVERDDRWIVIKPWSELGPPILPEDRFAARKLIQSGLSLGYFTLEAMAEHSLSANDQWNATSFNLARILLPRSERILQDASLKALRFYGSLSPVQQRSLRDGQTIDQFVLSPNARQALMEVALNPGDIMSFGGLYVNGKFVGARLETDLDEEPTEFLAGRRGGGNVTSKFETVDQLLVGTMSGKYVAWTRFIKPEGINAARGSNQGVYTKEDEFWMGSTVNMKLSISLSKGVELRLTLPEHRYDLRKDGLKLEKLPEGVRKKIEGG